MASNRNKARERFITNVAAQLDELLPGCGQGAYIRDRLSQLSDAAFDRYMRDLSSGKEILPLTAPNLVKQQLTIDNNLRLAYKLGSQYFKH